MPTGLDLPVIYYRRGWMHARMAEQNKRSLRWGLSRRYHQRQAMIWLKIAELGARDFPDEGRWMADA